VSRKLTQVSLHPWPTPVEARLEPFPENSTITPVEARLIRCSRYSLSPHR
jgi:hypothetical protein